MARERSRRLIRQFTELFNGLIEFLELMKQRDEYLAELNNISMNKRMGSLEDSVRNDCARLQAQVDSLKDDLVFEIAYRLK